MINQELEKLYQRVKALSGVYKNREDVERYLKQQTINKNLVNEVLHRLQKDELDAKNKKGVIKLLLGGLLLVTSFIVTCINFHCNQPFALVMYGFTTVGLVLLVWGLYDLLH